MPWEPDFTIEEELGRFHLFIQGEDVTFFRGKPIHVKNWVINEPFDDATLEVEFPQITPFETFPTFFQNPFNVPYWANAELYLFPPVGNPIGIWEGMVASLDDNVDEGGYSVTMHLIGALYQLDLYVSFPPIIQMLPTDIGQVIADEFNNRPMMRTGFCPPAATGILTQNPGGGENRALSGYVQGLIGTATTEDGQNQWTVMKNWGRFPIIRLKDRTTVHWTIRCGTPGVTHQLSEDATQTVTTIFGEGVDADGCHWRNTKYPNLHPDTAPIWPGCLIPGCPPNDVAVWEQRMHDNGWGIRTDGVYGSTEAGICRRFQASAGIQVDGVVGPQTWAATFNPGENEGDLTGAYFQPLCWDERTEPWYYTSSGGRNPNTISFGSWPIRVERWENFGNKISKYDAMASACAELARDEVPALAGTITLKTDPLEGSRFLMRAGQNLMYQGHRGVDKLFHISQASVDLEGQTTSLTVDEKARDLMTLQQVWARDRDSTDPTKKIKGQHRNSRQTEDRIVVWDCENGAGVIPRMGIYRRLWNVIHIPAGERGSVAKIEVHTDAPAEFAIGVFDRHVTHQQIIRLGNPTDSGFWDSFTEDYGLVIAWGGAGNMCGYWPKAGPTPDAETGLVAPKTGQFHDEASWTFESTQAPWLWIALWCETTTYIQGLMSPAWNG